MGALDGGQSALNAAEARRASPEAFVARELSQTKYERLNAEQAARTAQEAFPSVINEPAGGPPQLPAGEKITTYRSDYTARVDLGGGNRGVMESSVPIAAETSPGRRQPVNLDLRDAGSSFQPVVPAIGVRIPKRLGDGARLSDVGVSLTPVDGAGSPLGGSEGKLDGATVLYANTQTDSDTVIKPLTFGFEADTLLRSVESPQQLYFRVGMPPGASLVPDENGSHGARIIANGQTLATVLAPRAQDAAGTSVPVSMSAYGNTLALTVDHRTGHYRYPIVVDPEIGDPNNSLQTPRFGQAPGNWQFQKVSPSFYDIERGEASHHRLQIYLSAKEPKRGEVAYMYYTTQGLSRISGVLLETSIVAEAGDVNTYAAIASSFYEAGPQLLQTGINQVQHPLYSTKGSYGDSAVFEAIYVAEHGSTIYQGEMDSAVVDIEQTQAPSVSFDTTDSSLGGAPNALYPGRWVNSYVGNVGLVANDPGVGIAYDAFTGPDGSEGWRHVSGCKGVQCYECWNWASQCTAGQSTSGEPLISNTEILPEGEDAVEGEVEDEAGLIAKASATVKVDNSPPAVHDRLVGLPESHELRDGQQYQLSASAEDTRSGVASIVLMLDGQQIGTPSGGCSPGPCTATGDWTLNGEKYGAGKHTLTERATDNAGNVSEEQYEITVHHASPVAMGPGSVNPATGDFDLSATDVSLAGVASSLTVQRGYSSRHLSNTAEGPLGGQWSLSVGGGESLVREPNGSMVVSDSAGHQTVFTSGPEGFTAPAGDSGLTLSEKKENGTSVFVLSQSGTATTFAIPSGAAGNRWFPTAHEGAGGTNVTTFTYQVAEGTGIVEPVEEIAPVPANVSCSPTLSKGCRALTFKYAHATTATGEGASEWGDYKGRLTQVYFTAWDPSKGEMTSVQVAQYAYDGKGRFRAEWDPRITPAPLKTTYGYDVEDHVTAVAPPGQQPWLMSYGTTVGDSNSGRLLSVTRPSASTALGDGSAPQSTASPTLSSTSPVIGTTLSVSSNGSWNNGPLAYAYQWEDCTAAECSPILGATNQTYTPQPSDAGYTLVAQVSAKNAAGAQIAASPQTSVVALLAPSYKLALGSKGAGVGQFNAPASEALSAIGDIWVTDYENNRLEELGPSDKFIEALGWGVKDGKAEAEICTTACQAGIAGSGTGQFSHPWGIAINETTGNIYVGDQSNYRIEELSPTGAFISSFGSAGVAPGQLGETAGLAIDPSGDVWITDFQYNLVDEFSSSGVYMTRFGGTGSGNGQFANPIGLAFSNGNIYVNDYNNNRIEVFSIAGAYIRQFGTKGSGAGQFSGPYGITTEPNSGDLYVTDCGNDRVEVFNPAGSYVERFGAEGSGNGQFSCPTGIVTTRTSELLVADSGNDRVEWWKHRYSKKNPVPAPPNPGTSAVTTIDYQVPVSGTEAPYEMSTKAVKVWAQADDPVEATAIFPADEAMGWPAASYKRATVYYLDGNNRTVNVVAPGGATSTSEYNATNDVVRTLTPDNRALALKEGSSSAKVAETLDTKSKYSVGGTELLSTLGPQHNIELESGSQALARRRTYYVYDEGAPPGGPYNLVTKIIDRADVLAKGEDERVVTTSYSGQNNLGWTLRKPTAVTTDAGGLNLVHTTQYEPGTGSVTETRQPAAGTSGEGTAHDAQTIYYTAASNAKYPACGEHPEWATLPCQSQPAAQPEGALPRLPVTTYAYNIWDEPITTTSTSGSSTRTTTQTYDGAGRPKTTAIAASTETALPMVTNTYNEQNGTLATQSTTTEGKTRKISSESNTLGEVVSYTDANENTTTASYDIDNRPETLSDGKGTQTLSYDTTTGYLTSLKDSAMPTAFTATLDLEGKVLTENYPNGMSANYTDNQVGEATALEYVKKTHCGSSCTWFSESIVPSIHGQVMTQTNSLVSQKDKYDGAGRLDQVQDTPAGQGCTTRLYGFDADTNRTSLTTVSPNAKGECTSEGGSAEKHTYDEADRLDDPGVSYSPFGNITALPATDAGGAELTSTFYANDQLASQKQGNQTIGYQLDPAGRPSETVSTGNTNATVISHYAGPGNAPAWTSNASGTEYTRNILGIGGTLVARQSNAESAVLQLTNLHGDIVATAYLSETAEKLAASEDTTEYGVPRTSLPPKYAWLGALEIPTELPSGVTAMGPRSYVPQLGRFLQPDPVSGGSANAYSYTFGDPINSSDPSGETSLLDLVEGHAARVAAEALAAEEAARRAAEEALARALAERAAQEAAAYAALGGGASWSPEGEEYWEEWEEEEGGYEYISDHHATLGKQETHVEPAVLYQPLQEAAAIGAGQESEASPNGGERTYVYSPCGGGGGNCRKLVRYSRHLGGPTVGQVFGWAKEAFGIAKCAYELYKNLGAGCGNP